MAIHWQVKFRPLRTPNELYTVNIYDASYTGTPVQLEGAAEPFVTEEDTDEDVFAPVRTHSGYIRIVDTGGLWQAIAPVTDTQRPVTLTNASGNVVWQGFIQSQNFGTSLYGDPQECEFPVQCPFATAGSRDVITASDTITEMKNFAFYLKRIIDYIVSASGNVIGFDNVYVQGIDTTAWNQLLALIDPLVFADLDRDENTIEANYTLLDVLEDICRYWGWTARTFGRDIYLTATNASSQTITQLTMANLTSYASGAAAGSTYTPTAITIGNVFASADNDITICRGYSKATVKGDAGNAEEPIECYPEYVEDKIDASTAPSQEGYGDEYVSYTGDISIINAIDLTGNAYLGSGFRRGQFHKRGQWSANGQNSDLIYIDGGQYNGTTRIKMQTVYEHNYASRYLKLKGTAYTWGTKLDYTANGLEHGGQIMKMCLGIGQAEDTAKWYNGSEWSSTKTTFDVTIGNSGTTLYVRTAGTVADYSYQDLIPVPNTDGYFGKLFVEFQGRPEYTRFDLLYTYQFSIADFEITSDFAVSVGTVTVALERDWQDSSKEYIAANTNIVQDETDVDCIFCSFGGVKYGYGIIAKSLGTPYVVTQEQTLANRICSSSSGFWRQSRRVYRTELLADDTGVAGVTPISTVTIASMDCIPISIGRSWRDDVAKMLFIQSN